jgi:hypothetical protein
MKVVEKISSWLLSSAPFGYSWRYCLLHPWILAKGIKDEVVYAYQRAVRGYDKTATYNVDSHLSELIPALIRELKAWGNGNPVYLPMSPKQHASGEGYEDDYARWHAILEEIIAGFEAAKALDGIGPAWEEYFTEWHKRYPHESMDEFDDEADEDGCVKSYSNPKSEALMKELNLWERDKQWRQEQMRLFHRGFILLHQYYFNLWD